MPSLTDIVLEPYEHYPHKDDRVKYMNSQEQKVGLAPAPPGTHPTARRCEKSPSRTRRSRSSASKSATVRPAAGGTPPPLARAARSRLKRRRVAGYNREGVNHYDKCKEYTHKYYRLIKSKNLGILKPEVAE